MRGTGAPLRALVALVLVAAGLASPSRADGQAASPDGPLRGPWSLRVSAGLGEGPSPTLMYGVGVRRSLNPIAGVGGDVHRWLGGAGVACAQSWPESYACSLRAVSLLVGGWVEPWRGRPLSPVLELGVGLLDRTDRVGQGTPSLGGSGSLGLRIDPGGWGSLLAFARRTVVHDDGYERLMGEGLRFWSVGLSLEIHPVRGGG